MNGATETGISPLAKIAGVWALVGITSWSEAASFAAFCLTVYLLCRHIWRDIARPLLERIGVLPAIKPQRDDDDALAGGA
jgi:hypothetical protein